jgi:hypothetical protein
VERLPIDAIRDAIESTTGRSGRQQGNAWRLYCPAHPDRRQASLSLDENSEHHALLYCHAGCKTDDILAAIGKAHRDLFPLRPDDRRSDPVVAIYQYTDEDGQLLYEVQRTSSKRFLQRRPDPDKPGKWIYNLHDTRRVLYRLPLVLEAIHDNREIYLVEGEKDVHTAEKLGRVATCNPGGAGRGKWLPQYTETLRGAHVVIIADNDVKGQGLAHARRVAQELQEVAASVVVGLPTVGKDLTDLVTAGLGIDDITLVDLAVEPERTGAERGDPADTRTGGSQADDGQGRPVDDPLVEGAGRRIRITPLSAFKIRPVRWVWEGRMPLGELCLIAGREGVGKSTFLAWLAAAVTNGNLPGLYQGEPRGVLYAAAEDAFDYTIAPRMLAAGANLDLVWRIDVEDEGLPTGLSLPRDSRALPEIAREANAAMLMCDPILSLVDGQINPNHSKELRTALEPLKRAAEAANLAIPALVHFNKTRDVDVSSMIAGSRAWTEVARAMLAIARDEREETTEYTCIVSQVKNNLGRLDLPNLSYTIRDAVLETDEGDAHIGRLVMLGETTTTAQDILQHRGNNGNSGTGGSAVVGQILSHLEAAGRGQSPKQIADATGIKPATVRGTLRRMVDERLIHNPTSGVYVLGVPAQVKPNAMCSVCGDALLDVEGTGRHPSCEPDHR